MLSYGRRVLQCDVVTPRELFRRALVIDFDPSTPTPVPLHPEHSELHQEPTQSGEGVDVLGSNREVEP